MRAGGRKIPGAIPPMLAKETDDAFDSEEWVYEIKWDGYRAIAEVKKGKIKLYSRNGLSFADDYPPIMNELKKIKQDVIIDGEIVVLDEKGISSFQGLQQYKENPDAPIHFYVFDLLELNGLDTTSLTLIERKELLRKIIPGKSLIEYSEHIEETGTAFFREAGKMKLEGIMAKKKDSEYHKGKRTSEWLKIKHHHTQEAIICGFTQPTGERQHFGALVLGMYVGKKLKYIGHTGTGFNHDKLSSMYKMMLPLKQKASPLAEVVKTNQPVTWIKPELVCEVKYQAITKEGLMRIPVFLGMRDDKSKKEVTMKATKKIEVPASKSKAVATKDKRLKSSVVKSSRKPSAKKEARVFERAEEVEVGLSFGKNFVKTTNTTKVYWPKEKITKGDVIAYYQSIAKTILPYLKDRPQSLKRNPNGITDAGFYHKDAGEGAPEFIKSIPIYSESSEKDVDYILCNDAATLAYLNNLGCIELNPWHSTTKKLDNPDYLVLDIDPSAKNTPDQVIETALAIHEVLERAGAENFCKTSGATGLHIYVPAGKKYTYEQVREFAHIICSIAHEDVADFTSLERNLKKRGNMIYLDYLQNGRGQTIASVYSLRPYPGASASTPLEWKEVKPGLVFGDFNIKTLPKRLEKKGDLFHGILGKGIDLRKCLRNLGG